MVKGNKIRKKIHLKKFRLSVSLKGYNAGTVLPLPCRGNSGIPLDKYWRRRLKEAKVDNCIELVPEPKPVKDKKETKN